MFCSLGKKKKKKKNAAAELFCTAMSKSKKRRSEVLITEMTREVKVGRKRWKMTFCP